MYVSFDKKTFFNNEKNPAKIEENSKHLFYYYIYHPILTHLLIFIYFR